MRYAFQWHMKVFVFSFQGLLRARVSALPRAIVWTRYDQCRGRSVIDALGFRVVPADRITGFERSNTRADINVEGMTNGMSKIARLIQVPFVHYGAYCGN